MKRPIKKHFTHKDLPETEYHQTIKESGDDPITMWLKDFVMSHPRDEVECKLSCDKASVLFRIFCFDSNLTNKLCKRQFSMPQKSRWKQPAIDFLLELSIGGHRPVARHCPLRPG